MLPISVQLDIIVPGDALQRFHVLLELLTQKVEAGYPNNVIIVQLENTATELGDQPMVLLVQRAITA